MARLTWQAGIAVSLGEMIEPASILAFGYEATVAGTTGTAEPAWPLVDGATVVDGTVTWTARAATTITWTARALYQTGASEPAWPTTAGATVVDGSVTWTAETPVIADSRCPHSKLAIAIASKIMSPFGDVLRYSATSDARDWSTANDAGWLPTGLQTPESPEVTALGEYRGRLAAWTGGGLQLWTVDPDPSLMNLFDTIHGIGTQYADSIVSNAGDLYFGTDLGIHSVSIAAQGETLQTGDIGTPIDTLYRIQLAGPYAPRSFRYPGSGQAWFSFGPLVYVYSQSRLGRVGAFSRYVFPFPIEYDCLIDSQLNLRSGDDVYVMDEESVTDDGTPFDGVVELPYLDFGNPGVSKMVHGFDVVGYGVPSISIGYDQTNPAAFTTPCVIPEDNMVGGMVPIPVMAPTISVRLTYTGGQAWQLNEIGVYLEDMRQGR